MSGHKDLALSTEEFIIKYAYLVNSEDGIIINYGLAEICFRLVTHPKRSAHLYNYPFDFHNYYHRRYCHSSFGQIDLEIPPPPWQTSQKGVGNA